MSSTLKTDKYEPKTTEFDRHEKEEREMLQNIVDNRASTKMEKEIAQAKLSSMEHEKLPPPHVHKHRIHDEELENDWKKDDNIFHNDESFQRYEMGGHQPTDKGTGSKVANQTNADYSSIKFNHKARGVTKENMEEQLLRDQMDKLPRRDL